MVSLLRELPRRTRRRARIGCAHSIRDSVDPRGGLVLALLPEPRPCTQQQVPDPLRIACFAGSVQPQLLRRQILLDVVAAPRATHGSMKRLNRGRMRNSNPSLTG
ncbi:hypothetical protein ZEAMMB73_Zm00001d030777 [Zea mays]|uniref:Uncharacterized protein n=1 Tax=Zea mays TaxID=4577 RepID=A0A1D6KED4_MAIZE|nr:hypothetical protein ZEAMMB73_Zm00001d030777 [Zea mays]